MRNAQSGTHLKRLKRVAFQRHHAAKRGFKCVARRALHMRAPGFPSTTEKMYSGIIAGKYIEFEFLRYLAPWPLLAVESVPSECTNFQGFLMAIAWLTISRETFSVRFIRCTYDRWTADFMHSFILSETMFH